MKRPSTVVVSQNEGTRASRVISVLFQDLTVCDAMQKGLVADPPFSSTLPGVPYHRPLAAQDSSPYGLNRRYHFHSATKMLNSRGLLAFQSEVKARRLPSGEISGNEVNPPKLVTCSRPEPSRLIR